MPKVTHFKGAEPGLEPELTVSFTTEATGQEGFQKKTKREPLGLAIRRPLESSRNRERSPRSGIEEGIGDLGAQGVEGSCGQCIQEHTLQNAQDRPRPRPSPWSGLGTVLKDLHLFLIPQPHSGKYVPTPYNHLITDIICYDLTTLPDYYSVRKYRNCFHYA